MRGQGAPSASLGPALATAGGDAGATLGATCMQMGMVGLGRMGANMTRRLMRGGHSLVVSDLSADAVKGIAGEGAVASSSLDDLVGKLKAPRAAWIMVPSGDATEKTVQA